MSHSNWNAHSSLFNSYRNKTDGEIDLSQAQFGVAANVMIAWQEVHDHLNTLRETLGRPLSVVDFGCGAGGFAKQLESTGDSVVAIDSSPSMLENASQLLSNGAKCILGGEQELGKLKQCDAIAANLVVNYLPELSNFARSARQALSDGGVLVFADLNPDYVQECLKRDLIYSDPDPEDNPRFVTLNFASGPVRLTLRDELEYKKSFGAHDFSLEAVTKPPLTNEFFEIVSDRTPENYPREIPRYCVYRFRALSQ